MTDLVELSVIRQNILHSLDCWYVHITDLKRHYSLKDAVCLRNEIANVYIKARYAYEAAGRVIAEAKKGNL